MSAHYKTLIQDELKHIEIILKAQFQQARFPVIQKIGTHLMKHNGKQLRPALLLLSNKACRGNSFINLEQQSDNACYLAAVIELIHTATLLHDDVIDRSTLRRNQMTAHHIWGNRTSILVGDFMFTRALKLTVQHSDQIWAITTALSGALNQMTLGEMMQWQHHFDIDIDETTYFQIIESKTAILFQTACEVAAHLSRKIEYIEGLKEFGLKLGIAFQLIDDLLDYTSNEQSLGKKIGDDFSEGKMTLPLIYALQHSPKKKTLKSIIATKKISELPRVIEIMEKSDAFKYTQDYATRIIDVAINALNLLPDSIYKAALIDMAQNNIYRDRQ